MRKLRLFDSLVKKILKSEGAKGTINIVVVAAGEMQRLNCEFRGKDKTTDVLAFSMNEGGILGDIAISERDAKKHAKRLVIHGVLHLLGYEHGRKMRNAEEAYKKF